MRIFRYFATKHGHYLGSRFYHPLALSFFITHVLSLSHLVFRPLVLFSSRPPVLSSSHPLVLSSSCPHPFILSSSGPLVLSLSCPIILPSSRPRGCAFRSSSSRLAPSRPRSVSSSPRLVFAPSAGQPPTHGDGINGPTAAADGLVSDRRRDLNALRRNQPHARPRRFGGAAPAVRGVIASGIMVSDARWCDVG